MSADPVGAPPDVSAWSGVEILDRLSGGVRNPVWLADRGTERLVVRVSGRSPESLAWELDLLDVLSAAGVIVPRSLVTDDGRRHDGGVLVQRFIPGGRPRDRHDWARVVAALAIVHEATAGWRQRPGFASAGALMSQQAGGDVDLAAMPPAAVALVRASWRAVLGAAECAIHGDLGAGNVLVDDEQVALIDWDEARVDVPAFDFAHLPDDVPVPVRSDRRTLVTAGVAWEAATCWIAEPDYAKRRLAELRDRLRA